MATVGTVIGVDVVAGATANDAAVGAIVGMSWGVELGRPAGLLSLLLDGVVDTGSVGTGSSVAGAVVATGVDDCRLVDVDCADVPVSVHETIVISVSAKVTASRVDRMLRRMFMTLPVVNRCPSTQGRGAAA